VQGRLETADECRRSASHISEHLGAVSGRSTCALRWVGTTRCTLSEFLSKRAPSSTSARFSITASYGAMSRRSGSAAKADNHSDISPFKCPPTRLGPLRRNITPSPAHFRASERGWNQEFTGRRGSASDRTATWCGWPRLTSIPK
jgi:hypothetical protein